MSSLQSGISAHKHRTSKTAALAASARAYHQQQSNYKLARHLIPEESLPFADKLDRFVARRGEPMLSVFTPEELNDEMSQIGFVEIETIPSEEQKRRYLKDRSDLVDLDPAPNFSFALFGVMK